MTTYSTLDDIETIRLRFLETWDDTVEVIFNNETDIKEPSKIWARLSFGPIQRELVGTGCADKPKEYEAYGRLYLQIMIPSGMADRQGWELANRFSDAFEDWHTPDYRIRFMRPTATPSDAEDDYYVIRLDVQWTARH